MALKALAASAALVCVLAVASARAQSLTAETTVVAGYSSDDLHAEAAQVRAFGELVDGIRYFGELTWGRSSVDGNDAFAAAYPYGDRLEVAEAYAERIFRPGRGLFAIRGGRFRPPFGIYNASDHAYNGFLRPPLVRYDEYAGVSNYMLEHGADVTVGVPWLTVEGALGAPADIGPNVRRSGLDAVTRLQAYLGQIIAGASYIHTTPVEFAGADRRGSSQFTGIDLRWANRGVQLRGEWMHGQPFDTATTDGWYADAIVHVIGMGPLTAVGRVERVDVDEPGERSTSSRQTVGGRLRMPLGFSLNLNVVHRLGDLKEYKPTSFDVGVMWSARRGLQ